jgi:DNA-binding CsgD family transcriptional regulator
MAPGTLKTYLTRLKEKLGAQSNGEVRRFAREHQI